MLDDLNLRVVSVRFHTQRGYDVANDLDRRIDATKAAMQMAYRLGATVVVNQIGRVPAETTDPGWQQLHEAMEDLGRHGAHVGAMLAAETGTEPAADLMRLLEACETGYVGVALNPANWIINSIDVSSNLKLVAPRVQLVVARDAVRDLAARRHIEVPLGQGMAEFRNCWVSWKTISIAVGLWWIAVDRTNRFLKSVRRYRTFAICSFTHPLIPIPLI